MNHNQPIPRDAEICRVLPCLPEKFIVDFANGIDVARDHNRVQKGRSGFFARLHDGFSGQGARRQNEINTSLTEGVEASLQYLNELSMSLAKSNWAMTQVNTRVAKIQSSLVELAHYSADTRQHLTQLRAELTVRCDSMEQEIAHVGLVQNARIHLDLVLSKWAAGKFSSFSSPGRCYATLEELRWGAFGDFHRKSLGSERDKLIETLQYRATSQLEADSHDKPSARIDTRQWLNSPTGSDVLPNAKEALAYIGDWSNEDSQPFVHSVAHRPENLPLALPRICSAERIAEALVNEVFGES